MTPPPSLQFCLCAVVDTPPPTLLSYRSIPKLLHVSFSVLHTWLQSVEILSVCTVMGPFVIWHQLHSIVLPPVPPRVWSFPFVTVRSPSVVPAAPPLSMLGPRASLHGSHDFGVVARTFVLHRSRDPGSLMPPVVLFTAVRKENCLPLKTLLVKTRRRALRRRKRRRRAPGPPAVARSRGNSPPPQTHQACSGRASCLLGAGRGAARGAGDAGGVPAVVLRRSVT